MHSVIRHCVIFIKSCGSEKIAQQQDRNHMRHAYPWCEQPPRYATLNTPAEDAVKTYGKAKLIAGSSLPDLGRGNAVTRRIASDNPTCR
ncbi:hypothetical protein GW17_00054718 [Ensete ventricosum]|nr:hypothetical protein GW17_00054718 [Ensete ventricosum]